MSLKLHYQDAKQNLREAGVETADLDARLLLQSVAGLTDTDFITADTILDEEQKRTYSNYIFRRMRGEPVSKILGHREFYGRIFQVTKDTLDPRPDTEILIEQALKWANEQGRPLSILDLGTGTGCIILTLLAEIPGSVGVACDVSPAALEVAKKNATGLGMQEKVRFIESDWFESVDGQYDMIVSNPPYIPNPDIATLAREVRNHDPILALDGGTDGLDAYKKVFSDIKSFLKPGGRAFFEFGFSQGENISRLVDDSHLYMVGITPDIAGIPRVVEISYGEK